jgi:2',3'-cyclic-nucleotide 2'-phosphodiesterase (5'-nucleotidase family)
MISVGCRSLPFNTFGKSNMILLDSSHAHTDPKIDKIIEPYMDEIDTLVNAVVGYNAHAMHVHKPESNLGNLLADYLLLYTSVELDDMVDLALFNTGGFRIPLPPGTITVGHIMQLMPFDNTLVMMTLSGPDMQALAEQIIDKGGDPISGSNGVVIQKWHDSVILNLGTLPISKNKNYRILTSSYLAEGGDGYSVLLRGTNISNSGVLIRDALQQMFQKETSQLKPAVARIEGRIVIMP